MDEKDLQIKRLQARIAELEAAQATHHQENEERTETEVSLTVNATAGSTTNSSSSTADTADRPVLSKLPQVTELSNEHIERYSRQMILSSTGLGSVSGQQRLLSSSVLLVGAGGIGSSAILYLAAAGVARLGIVDFDVVELSNLHRQVLHSTDRVGWNKAVSAQHAVHKLNPTIECVAYPEQLNYENVQELISTYHCVVDCSDNPRTRYLINDACVLTGKPLVSGSAVGTEGQLTVYNSQSGGPCYRCLYPRPSATAGCRACADAGVLGPVPGLIGILQAMEVLKLLAESGSSMDQRLLMYDALACTFLTVQKPPKQPKCPVCGTHATVRSMLDSQESLLTAQGPQEQRNRVPFSELPDSLQATCLEYQKVRENQLPHILLDVRVPAQYKLCSLPGSLHISLAELMERLDDVIDNQLANKPGVPVYCICRRGIDSVEAIRLLHQAKPSHPNLSLVFNIQGGLDAWRKTVDPSFPKY